MPVGRYASQYTIIVCGRAESALSHRVLTIMPTEWNGGGQAKRSLSSVRAVCKLHSCTMTSRNDEDGDVWRRSVSHHHSNTTPPQLCVPWVMRAVSNTQRSVMPAAPELRPTNDSPRIPTDDNSFGSGRCTFLRAQQIPTRTHIYTLPELDG